MPTDQKKIYLTFDDGPHVDATPFVLEQLKRYQAKATFFCIGKNVIAHPVIYQRIIDEGHAVGNHTFNHLNGWKTPDAEYLKNITDAQKYIDSNLFRPPYGRATHFQLQVISGKGFNLKPIMWSVLSGDFDSRITKKKCLHNVLFHAGNGSIIVFHDSEKAMEKMMYALPEVLAHFSSNGYTFEKINVGTSTKKIGPE